MRLMYAVEGHQPASEAAASGPYGNLEDIQLRSLVVGEDARCNRIRGRCREAPAGGMRDRDLEASGRQQGENNAAAGHFDSVGVLGGAASGNHSLPLAMEHNSQNPGDLEDQ